MQIFADTCDLVEIQELLALGLCDGVTSNPTLLRQAGVAKVTTWARDVLSLLGPSRHLSVPVLADEDQHILLQAFLISELGPNVFAKIPHQRKVWREALENGSHVNVTAITKSSQFFVDHNVEPLPLWTSVFAGRITDTGMSATWALAHVRDEVRRYSGKVIWASTRELYNFYQAQDWGADAITATPALIKKWNRLRECGLDRLSDEVVEQFSKDAGHLLF